MMSETMSSELTEDVKMPEDGDRGDNVTHETDERKPEAVIAESVAYNEDVKMPEDGDRGDNVTHETDERKPDAVIAESVAYNEDCKLHEVPDDPFEPVNKPPNDSLSNFSKPTNKSKEKSKKDTSWKTFKGKVKSKDFSQMSLEEKRSYYRCEDNFVTLDEIKPWPDYVRENYDFFTQTGLLEKDAEFTEENEEQNRKISLWQGDITSLEIDAIVNAANRTLLGGGGVDGCIHRAAGKGLLEECRKLHGCATGDAKITLGYKLPAKHVIHTVGPIGERSTLLENCYKSCLRLMKEHKLNSVAFCCVSTGIYGYPNKKAAKVALKTVKDWLEENKDWIGRIIFCVYLEEDLEIYHKLLLQHFPCTVGMKRTDSNDGGMADLRAEKVIKSASRKNHPKGRGRGRGAPNKNTSKAQEGRPTLISIVQSQPKVRDSDRHTDDSKGETKEKMDTSEDDNTATGKESTGFASGNEESATATESTEQSGAGFALDTHDSAGKNYQMSTGKASAGDLETEETDEKSESILNEIETDKNVDVCKGDKGTIITGGSKEEDPNSKKRKRKGDKVETVADASSKL